MRILVLQHVDVEHPGVFRDFWRELGHSWLAVELDRGEVIPELGDFDVMVVMGGPMDVWQEDLHPWLRAEKAAIREWVLTLGRPFWGICLGHQLLGEVLGGSVGMMPQPEVGLTTVTFTPQGQVDPLMAGFAEEIEVFQWHGAEVYALPPQVKILASNGACRTQAIRYGRHAYGLQYHCEISINTVNEWQQIPAYQSSLEAALGQAQARTLAATVMPRLPGFRESARRLNANFLALI